MSNFLHQNAALLIAILALLVNIVVKWDEIMKRFRLDESVPFIIFKLLAISLSGTFVVSIFWFLIDFLSVGRLSLNAILLDVASGAAIGAPIALLSGILSKDLEGAVISGIFFSIIILLIFGPDNIMHPAQADIYQKKLNSVVLLSVVGVIGVMSGYSAFKTRTFIDSISTNPAKS